MLVLMVGNPGRIEEGHVGSLIIFRRRILGTQVGDVICCEERAGTSGDVRPGGEVVPCSCHQGTLLGLGNTFQEQRTRLKQGRALVSKYSHGILPRPIDIQRLRNSSNRIGKPLKENPEVICWHVPPLSLPRPANIRPSPEFDGSRSRCRTVDEVGTLIHKGRPVPRTFPLFKFQPESRPLNHADQCLIILELRCQNSVLQH